MHKFYGYCFCISQTYSLKMEITLGLFTVILTIFQVVLGEGGSVSWVQTGSSLPFGILYTQAVYDEVDSIYTFGGWNASYIDQIFKYSITEDSVQAINGEFPKVAFGAALMDPSDNESIYYIGGGIGFGSRANISKCSTSAGECSSAGSLPTPIEQMASCWSPGNHAFYIFGGLNSMSPVSHQIFEYSPYSGQVIQIGTFPEGGKYRSTAAWAPTTEKAYIFGGIASGVSNPDSEYEILEFDPATSAVRKLSTRLPYRVSFDCAVYSYVDQYMYILHSKGLMLFNPVTEYVEEVQVDTSSWPFEILSADCAYVKELNRIYVFGGMVQFHDELELDFMTTIAYIDLDIGQASPSTTTEGPSHCPPTGVHTFPYPGNCTLYIKCFDGIEQILSCAPLIFDKIDLVCKTEDEAVCDEEDPPNECPPDGYEAIPHPSNCTKYYECINGNQYESECAVNTYFDASPELLHCNRAELALCHAECPETGLEFQAIRAVGCKWYKVCLEGVSANLQCGESMIFNPVELRCVDDADYNCPY